MSGVSPEPRDSAGKLFELEFTLRQKASASSLLELDGVLVDMEVDEDTRAGMASVMVEKLIEGNSNA